jgi:hypothetical protein
MALRNGEGYGPVSLAKLLERREAMKALLGSIAAVALLATPAVAQTTNKTAKSPSTKTVTTKSADEKATTTVTTKGDTTTAKTTVHKRHHKAKRHHKMKRHHHASHKGAAKKSTSKSTTGTTGTSDSSDTTKS